MKHIVNYLLMEDYMPHSFCAKVFYTIYDSTTFGRFVVDLQQMPTS